MLIEIPMRIKQIKGVCNFYDNLLIGIQISDAKSKYCTNMNAYNG